MAENRRNRAEGSSLNDTMVSSDMNNMCHTCMFRHVDMFDGKISGGNFDTCSVYTKVKPHDVFCHHAQCQYYIDGDPE